MFIGGTDTIYKAIEWTMAELVKNPREMEKMQAEARQVAAGTKGGVLEEDLEKMSFLQAAMKEALRLHPPITLFPHESIQNTRLHGYDIPAKTRVMINAWAIGRDGESWEEADKFRQRGWSSMSTMGVHKRDLTWLSTRTIVLVLSSVERHLRSCE
ncbi:Cytochrome P450 71A1 [Hordeum vulgare]|nr:Cytochrome P450 71A1 [Hordeum vulgare]